MTRPVDDDAIVRPVVTAKTPQLGPVAVLVSSKTDLNPLRHALQLNTPARPLYNSQLYYGGDDAAGPSIVGPIIGAPYAAMVLETLVAWGAERFVFLGWCGAIDPKVGVGDIVVPSCALIDEGTSVHYGYPSAGFSEPSTTIRCALESALTTAQSDFKSGAIWTTDAVFRETVQKVGHHQQQGVLAVEMEVAALFCVARFRHVKLGALLVVSDDLSTFKWRPGFRSPEFKTGRRNAIEVIATLCRTL